MNKAQNTDDYLPTYTHDEDNGLDYTLVGDYYLPNLFSPEEDIVLGVWAIRRVNYLREHKPLNYINLVTEGKLSIHLKEVDEQAKRRMQEITDKMIVKEGLSEELKRQDPMCWVGLMNNIRDCERDRRS